MKPIRKPVTHYMRDVYLNYVGQLLEKNPTWFSRYEGRLKLSHCYIYAKEKGKVVLKMSWFIWKETVERFYHKAKYAIISGETLKIGSNLGKIRGARIQRSFTTPKIDWRATKELNMMEGEFLKKVYYTDDDYCRIQWLKYQMVPNETHYCFDPAEKNTKAKKGFKIEFSQALTKNPLLKYKYKYYPLISAQ